MPWIVWWFLAALNFGCVALDYLSWNWPLFFINLALGFLFAHLALKSPGRQFKEHEDE